MIVFDGSAPEGSYDDGTLIVGAGGESDDDWIARHAAELAERGEPYWLVTSDRELRRRAGTAAERVLGGGTFAGHLADSR